MRKILKKIKPLKKPPSSQKRHKPKEKPKGKRSYFEEDVHKALLKKGKNVEYETEKLPYVVKRNYIPDFILFDKFGNKVYIEAKGRFTSSDRTKMVAVKREHPELDIRIIFMQDNYLTKRKIKRYTQWAADNGFPCSVFPKLPI